jgi:hypothetical protein
MKHEIIENGTVVNTIIASPEFMAENFAPDAYRVAPEPSAPTAVVVRHITKLGFRNRFTRAEKVVLEMAALDNPAASMAQRQQSAALRADLKDQEGATFIDLDRADLRAGVQALEAAGLIAAGRALQILDAPVQEIERFRGG